MKKVTDRGGMLATGALIFCIGLILALVAHSFVKPIETALHEIGFALMVSVVVWRVFEHQLSRDADRTWDARVDRVTENVFKAVLRKDLPKGLLDEANNLVLNSSIIRSGFTVTYTLIDGTFQDGEAECDCVLVEAVMEFRMKNVGTDTFCWKAGIGLPNPIHPDLKRQVRVRAISASKGGEPVHFELERAHAAFRDEMERSDGATTITFCAGVVELQPQEECEFSATYVMAKEAEDSEFLQTLFPADGMRVTLFDTATDGRRVTFARSVHRKALESLAGGQPDPHSKIFKVSGYLLPHQGVLIWWKKRPTDAQRSLPIA